MDGRFASQAPCRDYCTALGADRLIDGYDFRRQDRNRLNESFDPRGRPRFALGAQPNKLKKLKLLR